MNLTAHFTLEEMTRSQTATRLGIDNTPPAAVVSQLMLTCVGLERIRELLRAPMIVTSGYRSPSLNYRIGGASSSQHTKGEAVDFVSPQYGSPKAVCQAIEASDIGFDQLIEEGTWVHVSFRESPRRQVLTARFSGGRVSYVEGLL